MVCWMKNRLMGRAHRVVVSEATSAWQTVTGDVPQGPVLFNVSSVQCF